MVKLNINMGTIWTMLVGTVMAVIYMFNTFATAADLKELAVDIHYDSYYSLVDRIDELEEELETDEIYLLELQRRLERMKSKICAEEPEWERCSGITE